MVSLVKKEVMKRIKLFKRQQGVMYMGMCVCIYANVHVCIRMCMYVYVRMDHDTIDRWTRKKCGGCLLLVELR